MESTDDLFQRVLRLNAEEIAKLVKRLNEYLSPVIVKPNRGSYTHSLGLSGIGDGDDADISSDKGRHLADVYATRR